jgi:site-specific DNA-methyltransferase (adenine-specific)
MVVGQDDKLIVAEMREARALLGESNAALGERLKDWQASLGFRKFKKNYQEAGWTESEVTSCFEALKNQLLKNEQVEDKKSYPQTVDSKEQSEGEYFDPLMSSKSDEWYTPDHIVQGVQDALGRIDLDPCSNSQKSVPAEVHFTKKDDGLAQSWAGNVYMNPPYGAVIGDWVEKLVQEYNSGKVTEAVALVPARVDTEWFRKFTGCVVVFVSGRLHFSNSENAAPFPSALVYLGKDKQKFKEAFAEIGRAWVEF